MNPILFICILTGIIHFTETAASSLRLAGLRTKQIATSLSFVNATLLITRTSNMLQAPFLGGMVDHAILTGNPESLINGFRLVIFAAFIGNLCGRSVPHFSSRFLLKAIFRFERVGSVPRLIMAAFLPRNFFCHLSPLPFTNQRYLYESFTEEYAAILSLDQSDRRRRLCHRRSFFTLCRSDGPRIPHYRFAALGYR